MTKSLKFMKAHTKHHHHQQMAQEADVPQEPNEAQGKKVDLFVSGLADKTVIKQAAPKNSTQ